MRKLSTREIVLLAAAAVGVAVWAVRPGTDASLPPLPGSGKGKEAVSSVGQPPLVELARLRGESAGYDPAGRDLFQYAQRPPSAAEVRRMEAEAREAERQRREAEEKARLLALQQEEEARRRAIESAKNPQPPPRARPPAVPVRYLGCMGPRGDRIAFFDHNKDLIMVKEGESFLKDFRLVKIGYESVTVGFTARQFEDDTQELPMSRAR